jgi:putative hydrolase of the HAD superfamily
VVVAKLRFRDHQNPFHAPREPLARTQDDSARTQDDRLVSVIRAVLFDIDDTLVDTRGAFRHALGTVAAEYLQRVPSADELANVWRTDAGGYYRAHTRGEISYREQRMLRANALHVMYGGPELDDEAYDAWNEDFERAFQEGWRAHEDAAASLDVLDAEGIPYGALSNAAVAYQELKLAKCGLERVPMLVGVDTLGFGKPDPRVFALACERIGFAPGEVAYVGDELDIDAQAAVAVGLTGIWLDRNAGADEPPPGILRISNLSEIALVTTI